LNYSLFSKRMTTYCYWWIFI